MEMQDYILWVIIGLWVSFKRNWYEKYDGGVEAPPGFIFITMSVLLGPIALLIAFVREMVFKKWDNN